MPSLVNVCSLLFLGLEAVQPSHRCSYLFTSSPPLPCLPFSLLSFLLVLFNIIFLSFYVIIIPLLTIHLDTHQQILTSVMSLIKKYCIYEDRKIVEHNNLRMGILP